MRSQSSESPTGPQAGLESSKGASSPVWCLTSTTAASGSRPETRGSYVYRERPRCEVIWERQRHWIDVEGRSGIATLAVFVRGSVDSQILTPGPIDLTIGVLSLVAHRRTAPSPVNRP